MIQAGQFGTLQNMEFPSNACKKLKTHTIKNPQHGVRAQMVLKPTNNQQMVETELTAALTSRSERVSLNHDARIRLQTKNFKQTFHHHFDNFISFPLIYGLWMSDAY